MSRAVLEHQHKGESGTKQAFAFPLRSLGPFRPAYAGTREGRIGRGGGEDKGWGWFLKEMFLKRPHLNSTGTPVFDCCDVFINLSQALPTPWKISQLEPKVECLTPIKTSIMKHRLVKDLYLECREMIIFRTLDTTLYLLGKCLSTPLA